MASGQAQLTPAQAREAEWKSYQLPRTSALEKSIELDEGQLRYISDEADLKPLSALPAFKKLLAPPPEKALEILRQVSEISAASQSDLAQIYIRTWIGSVGSGSNLVKPWE